MCHTRIICTSISPTAALTLADLRGHLWKERTIKGWLWMANLDVLMGMYKTYDKLDDKSVWLVVEPPLWKRWFRQFVKYDIPIQIRMMVGWWHSQLMEKHSMLQSPSHYHPAMVGPKKPADICRATSTAIHPVVDGALPRTDRMCQRIRMLV